MFKTTKETIETLDTKLIDKLIEELGNEPVCKDHSCECCQLKIKMKGSRTTKYLKDPELHLKLMVNAASPESIFMSAFLVALQYCEMKELEELGLKEPPKEPTNAPSKS